MNDLNRRIRLFNGSQENIFIAVRQATKQFKYSGQYLRKLLRNEKLYGIKIGQSWLIECKSLLDYIEEASTIEDLRYGPRIKICVNEKPTKQG